MGVIQEWVEQGVKQCRLNDKVPDGLPQGVCGTHARVFRMAEIKIFEENIKQCRLKARFQTAFKVRENACVLGACALQTGLACFAKKQYRRSCAGRSPVQSKALLVWRIAGILVL